METKLTLLEYLYDVFITAVRFMGYYVKGLRFINLAVKLHYLIGKVHKKVNVSDPP